MDDKKPCVRCDRRIDAYARICPYCNYDQTAPAPPADQKSATPASTYVPPAERNWRRHLMMIAGGVLLLVASFVVGAVINRDDTPRNAPKPVTDAIGEEQPSVPPARRSDLTLVPVADGFEQPITSAPVPNPAEGVPTEYQRSDATAVSSVEYTALAQRAQAERERQKELVDPRSLTGPAYAQGRPPRPARPPENADRTPPPMTSAARDPEPSSPREPARVVRFTRPVPQSQPLPNIRVSQSATARLELTIGPDGRVKQINVKSGVPGHTPALIAAVQRWRFKPATENGVPVSAPFSVDISFEPND